MTPEGFDSAVFINCPFDSKYEPILQSILFCVVFLGFTPRLATERSDSGENRIDKIRELIEASRYSIHNLSRCQVTFAGEHYRLNMPFELGMDYGCRRYLSGRETKRTLILEEQPYRYQAAISDLAGWDIQHHKGDYRLAVAKVRHWLVDNGAPRTRSPTSRVLCARVLCARVLCARVLGARVLCARVLGARVLGAYADFQAWNYERLLADGWSEDDIQDCPTGERLTAMLAWMAAGAPPG